MLYIGDVGQYRFEEINVVPADHAGANFGWSVREGTHCFPDLDAACQTQQLIDPLLKYPHQPECAVIGGYVYDGIAMPALRGHYFYSDLCAGWLRSFRLQAGQAADRREWTSQVGKLAFPTSFGVDGSGELYITAGDGTVYQLIAGH
jgi:glucose/arabinose dehydrogenase